MGRKKIMDISSENQAKSHTSKLGLRKQNLKRNRIPSDIISEQRYKD